MAGVLYAQQRVSSEAKVDLVNGVPRLTIDGEPTLPLVFFHNTDVRGKESDRYLREQVALARNAGIHLYSLPLRCPRLPDGTTPNYGYSDSLLDRFIAVDPDAFFILRVYPGPNWSWREVKNREIPDGEYVRFADGSKGRLSLASEWFRRAANADLAELVSHYEASAYSHRIIAWQPGGPYHEMFLLGYRRSGPDCSQANHRGFRKWLRREYRTDTALRQAWNDPEITLDAAPIPAFEAGRFPMRRGAGGKPIQVFYDIPREQNWIDFSAYMSDITAERIVEWARVVKERSSGRKLTAFFYGYTFDLPGSFSGHYRLHRVLECAEVDMLASPYSYLGRFAGDPGNFMSPVDSVIAHGKLWFNEDDTRTSLIDMSKIPKHFTLFNKKCADMHETLNVLERNFGALLAHRAATWWMDLVSRGAFNHPDLWRMLRDRMRLYAAVYRDPKPYRPDVAVVVDEESKLYVKDDWDTNYWTMYYLRDQSAKAGTSVGYYTLADFIGGAVPVCRAYVFANAFRLTEAQMRSIRSRLDHDKATAIWIYAPGYIGSGGAGVGGVVKMTGIQVKATAGPTGSEGVRLLKGESWGARLTVSPRLVVTDSSARALGRYRTDGGISSAERTVGNHRSVFLGDMGPSAAVLRRLFRSAGCHIWASGGEIVQTDGAFLMVHAGRGGVKRIALPSGISADPIEADVVSRRDGAVEARFQRGDTAWFRLRRSD